MFAVYGEEEVFWQVLDRYGHEVIPVIASYVEHGSRELQVRQTVRDAWARLWAGQNPKWELSKLTHEQIGLIAIDRLAARGHEMLAEFEIVDGVAKRKPVTSVILGTKDMLLGDLGDLEKILVRGERLPTWEEVGLAGLDLTVVVGAVGSFAKIARAGRGTVIEKSAGRVMVEGALATVTTVGRAGRRIAPLALVYVAVTRPELIASIGGWIAEQLGLSRMVGIFAVYFFGLLLILWSLSPLIWCGRLLCSLYRWLAFLWLLCVRARGHAGAALRTV